jgi:transcriptional regulator with XRE-family HTH domain
MSEQMKTFGDELRRRRAAANLSLSDLAMLVHYSKGHLSKIENGQQRPSPALARQCDAALDAKGELTALAPRKTASSKLCPLPPWTAVTR